MLSRLSEVKSFAFDIETSSLNAMSAKLVGISLSPVPGEAYYIPVGHSGWEQFKQMPLELVLSRLKPLLEDSGHTKFAHNGKFDVTVLAEYGINVKNLVFDSM